MDSRGIPLYGELEGHHCGENRGSSLWRIKGFLSMESRGAFSNWNGHIFNFILFAM